MKAVILAGGSGTRLFPLSRKNLPKQFLKVADDQSLFQKTIDRALKIVKNPKDVIIITNKEYIFHLKSQLREINHSEKDFHIITEPVGRNTAPAIALAVKYLIEKQDIPFDETIFISPSDHIIQPVQEFVEYVKKADELAKEGYIITFGVKPTKPETGYGYIEAGEKIKDGYKVIKFHEKPSIEKATEYLMKGNFYWNSGMFTFSIQTILEEFKNHSEEIYQMINDNNFEELLKNFEAMPDISIDYAVMEKTNKAAVIPMNITWSDVGSWDSVYEILPKDENQNVKVGKVIDIDTKNSMIIGNKRVISTIGLENLMIVETDDVILIAKQGEGQKVREIVNKIKNDKEFSYLVDLHTTVYRPWGSYTELEKGERYRIKRITVYPGESLSLQMHYHRSEHWIVVKGTAKVVLEENGEIKEYFVHENESIYVPKTTKHRLVNPGRIPLELIEVQVGEYVEEDDIVRFNDVYGRC
jgi:mannose-1-phosphate guanylyltransferase/mannose-6-phosphate isomerase